MNGIIAQLTLLLRHISMEQVRFGGKNLYFVFHCDKTIAWWVQIGHYYYFMGKNLSVKTLVI